MAAALVQRLAAEPPLADVLRGLAAAYPVQVALSPFLDVTPEALLSVVLALLVVWASILAFTSKGQLACWGGWYMLASSDKKTRKPGPAINFDDPNGKRVKIVFIRHGESEWNWIFNKGFVLVRPIRFFLGLLRELGMFFSQDSLFFDSPLSKTGLEQAMDLLQFLASQPAGCVKAGSASSPTSQLEVTDLVSIVRGDAGASVVVSSILRRAISTGVVGLSARLLKNNASDKILLMTSLQEISRNVDTLAIAPAQTVPAVPAAEAEWKGMGDLIGHFYRESLDPSLHTGNKRMNQKAMQRHDEFVTWAFSQKEYETIIVCGHSLWFREFFRSYLPAETSHEAKDKKMANCGVVAFDLHCASARTGAEVVQIRPGSVKTIYKGFEGKETKSKKA